MPATLVTVFTTGAVAKICKVAPRTVSKWFDSGKLKGYRIPGSQDRRIPRANLIAFLKQHSMPLGALEEEEWFHVVSIGLGVPKRNVFEKKLTENDGYKLTHVDSVFAAGSKIQNSLAEAVVIDFCIGRVEAVSVAGAINALDLTTAPIVIGIAADDESEDGRKALVESHGFDLIVSDNDLAAAVDRIEELAELRRNV